MFSVGRIRTSTDDTKLKGEFKKILMSSVTGPYLGLMNHTTFRQIKSGETVPLKQFKETKILFNFVNTY